MELGANNRLRMHRAFANLNPKSQGGNCDDCSIQYL